MKHRIGIAAIALFATLSQGLAHDACMTMVTTTASVFSARLSPELASTLRRAAPGSVRFAVTRQALTPRLAAPFTATAEVVARRTPAEFGETLVVTAIREEQDHQ